MQEACLKALAAIGDGIVLRPRAWLLAVVRNTAFTWMAKNRPKWVRDLGDVAEMDRMVETGKSAFPDVTVLTPEVELIRKADAVAVRKAVAALPILLREVLVLRELVVS